MAKKSTAATASERIEADPLDDLPFVKLEEAGRNFWSVSSTGDCWQDVRLGHEYALAALEFEARPGVCYQGYLLNQALVGMGKDPALYSIESAFRSVICAAAATRDLHDVRAHVQRCLALIHSQRAA